MAYSTQADIEKRIPSTDLAELTNDTDGSSVVTANVDEAIALADALINSFLRGKHEVPLSTVPDLIREFSVTISIYNLYQRRIDLSIPEVLQSGYKDALKQLGMVRDNKLMIDDVGSVANTAGYYESSKGSAQTIYDTNSTQTGTLDKFFSNCRIVRRR